MDVLYNSPEDVLLDREAEEIEDAADDVLYDNGNEIDIIGDITDEDIENSEYDPEEDLDEYIDNDYTEVNDVDIIDNGDTEYEEFESSDEDSIAEIENVLNNEYDYDF